MSRPRGVPAVLVVDANILVAAVLGSATGAHLDLISGRRSLITSEEDVMITLMCRAEGMTVYGLETLDPTWATMNWIGADALTAEPAELPFVIHPLKATPEGLSLRAKLGQQFPLLRSNARDQGTDGADTNDRN